MTCKFYVFSIVFQSYQENARSEMKGLSTIERSQPQAGLEPGTARSVDQSYRGSLQNKPCKDGLVEEDGGGGSSHTP